jgi:hypothetical protein
VLVTESVVVEVRVIVVLVLVVGGGDVGASVGIWDVGLIVGCDVQAPHTAGHLEATRGNPHRENTLAQEGSSGTLLQSVVKSVGAAVVGAIVVGAAELGALVGGSVGKCVGLEGALVGATDATVGSAVATVGADVHTPQVAGQSC